MNARTKLAALLAAAPLLITAAAHAQDPAHATEYRMQHPGNGPGGEPRVAFLVHRLGSDHAEGISTLDMNGDGFVDLLSGAYWYENPGADGGEWKRHQFRTVGMHNEFVSDCGEWIVDVDHDGLPDLVTTGWITNGLWWYRNPGPKATAAGEMWKAEKITDSYDTEGGAFADIDGDGVPELITGKRYRGHSGADPGSYDPIVVYAYKLPTKELFAAGADPGFTRFALSVNGTASAGTQFVAADFDHDGDIDLASAGKLGVHVFENLKVVKVPKSVREATQPLNRDWPFPGEGKEVEQEEEPGTTK